MSTELILFKEKVRQAQRLSAHVKSEASLSTNVMRKVEAVDENLLRLEALNLEEIEQIGKYTPRELRARDKKEKIFRYSYFAVVWAIIVASVFIVSIGQIYGWAILGLTIALNALLVRKMNFYRFLYEPTEAEALGANLISSTEALADAVKAEQSEYTGAFKCIEEYRNSSSEYSELPGLRVVSLAICLLQVLVPLASSK